MYRAQSNSSRWLLLHPTGSQMKPRKIQFNELSGQRLSTLPENSYFERLLLRRQKARLEAHLADHGLKHSTTESSTGFLSPELVTPDTRFRRLAAWVRSSSGAHAWRLKYGAGFHAALRESIAGFSGLRRGGLAIFILTTALPRASL